MVGFGCAAFHQSGERLQYTVDPCVNVLHKLGADSGVVRIGLDFADKRRGLDRERTDIVGQRHKRVKLVAAELHPGECRRDCGGELGNIGIEKRVSLRLCDFLAGGDITSGVAVADCENSGWATVGSQPTPFPRLDFCFTGK